MGDKNFKAIINLRVITYIDGFNLYHSIADLIRRNTSLKHLQWQNLISLSKQFLSRNDTLQTTYFFSAYPYWKPNFMQEHKDYIAILEDLGIKIVLGNFKEKKVYCHSCHTTITKHEEKQTDVNIAMQIMRDCYEKKCDCMQIISADTDLATPIKFAKDKGIKIDIVLPPYRISNELTDLSDKKSNIKTKHLQNAYLGQTFTLKSGKILQNPYSI